MSSIPRGYNTGIPRHKYSSDSGDEHNPDLISAEENGLERCSSIRNSRNLKTNWSVGRRLAKLAKGLPKNMNFFWLQFGHRGSEDLEKFFMILPERGVKNVFK